MGRFEKLVQDLHSLKQGLCSNRLKAVLQHIYAECNRTEDYQGADYSSLMLCPVPAGSSSQWTVCKLSIARPCLLPNPDKTFTAPHSLCSGPEGRVTKQLDMPTLYRQRTLLCRRIFNPVVRVRFCSLCAAGAEQKGQSGSENLA